MIQGILYSSGVKCYVFTAWKNMAISSLKGIYFHLPTWRSLSVHHLAAQKVWHKNRTPWYYLIQHPVARATSAAWERGKCPTMNVNVPFDTVRQISSRSQAVIHLVLESLNLITSAILVIAMTIATHEIRDASTSLAKKTLLSQITFCSNEY